MTVTKSQKIACAGLAVAVLALAADRLRGSGGTSTPTPAGTTESAGTAETPTATASATPSTRGEDPSWPATMSTTDRLRAIRAALPQPGETRDAFAASAGFLRRVATAAEAPAGQFQSQHRLKMIVQNGERSTVLLDGTLVGIGQSVGGYRLESVGKSAAVFDDGSGPVTLKLGGDTP